LKARENLNFIRYFACSKNLSNNDLLSQQTKIINGKGTDKLKS
jgi:hypothetical protein